MHKRGSKYQFVCMSCQSIKKKNDECTERITNNIQIKYIQHEDDIIFESYTLLKLFFIEKPISDELLQQLTIRIQDHDFFSLKRIREACARSLLNQQCLNLLSVLQHRVPFTEVFDVHRKMVFSSSSNLIRYIRRESIINYTFVQL